MPLKMGRTLCLVYDAVEMDDKNVTNRTPGGEESHVCILVRTGLRGVSSHWQDDCPCGGDIYASLRCHEAVMVDDCTLLHHNERP